MPESLISALIQAPFVLIMAYLVHRFLAHLNARDLEWRAFTEEMHQSMGDRLGDLTDAIDRLSHLSIAHNAMHDATTRLEKARQSHDGEVIPLRKVS